MASVFKYKYSSLICKFTGVVLIFDLMRIHMATDTFLAYTVDTPDLAPSGVSQYFD